MLLDRRLPVRLKKSPSFCTLQQCRSSAQDALPVVHAWIWVLPESRSACQHGLPMCDEVRKLQTALQ